MIFMFNKSKKRTWKREVALLLIGVLGYAIFKGEVGMVETIIWPILTFAALAFGLDWYGKSTGMRPEPTFTTQRQGD